MGRRKAGGGTRTGLAGFLVGGGVLAGLQILQQVVGAFDPRELVTVLIAVAVALATTAAAKWRARTQRGATLEQELRSWPLPLLKDADPLLLGVWPERERGKGANGEPAEYAEREVDGPLRRALDESSFVLVYGPPRAGKSRTAAEAARRALGDTPVIVPRGPDAFDALLDPDLQLERQGAGVVLWLDGLERYADAIDATRLDALAGIGGDARIVATVRTGEWETMLDASGQRGEAAKAIAARARAFEVPADEADVGAERSTSGKDEAEPAPLASAPERGVGQRSGWGDRWLALPAAGSLAVLLALAVTVALAGFSKSIPPPVSEQVRDIKRDATRGDQDSERDDRHTVISPRVDLQGGGENSYVFVFQDAPDLDSFFKLFGGDDPRRPVSDELRVYDLEDGRLNEKFRFQPDGRGREAAIFARRGDAGDVDRDEADELIAGYGLPLDASQAQVPFALDWDDARERYRMVALELEPPALPERALDPRLEPLFAAYTRPITLRDSDTGRELSGYRVQDFAVDPEPAFRLLAGYLVEARSERHDGVMRLEPYQFRTGAPRVRPCEISERAVRAVISKGGGREQALLDKWEEVSKERKCVPRP